MRTIDNWGPEVIALMVENPTFTSLRTANCNALVLFANGTHGVFLCSDVDEAYRQIGRRPFLDPAALPARKTKKDVFWLPSGSESDDDPQPNDTDETTGPAPTYGQRLMPTGPRLMPTPDHHDPLDARSSSSSAPSPADYPLVPRAPWMLDGDS